MVQKFTETGNQGNQQIHGLAGFGTQIRARAQVQLRDSSWIDLDNSVQVMLNKNGTHQCRLVFTE